MIKRVMLNLELVDAVLVQDCGCNVQGIVFRIWQTEDLGDKSFVFQVRLGI